MNLLKSSFLILLMILAGCSSKSEKPTAVPLEPVIDHAWLDDYEPRLRDALKESRC